MAGMLVLGLGLSTCGLGSTVKFQIAVHAIHAISLVKSVCNSMNTPDL